MSLEMLLLTLIPLMLFVAAEIFFGLKAALTVALSTSLFLMIYFYFRLERFDSLMLVEVALFFILGGISWKMMNDKFFKFQPVIVAVVLSLYVAYCHWTGDPVFVRMAHLFEKIDPRLAEIIDSNVGRAWAEDISLNMIVLLVAHGILVAWGALKLKSFGWLLTRLAFYPMALVVFLWTNKDHQEFLYQLQKMSLDSF